MGCTAVSRLKLGVSVVPSTVMLLRTPWIFSDGGERAADAFQRKKVSVSEAVASADGRVSGLCALKGPKTPVESILPMGLGLTRMAWKRSGWPAPTEASLNWQFERRASPARLTRGKGEGGAIDVEMIDVDVDLAGFEGPIPELVGVSVHPWAACRCRVRLRGPCRYAWACA